MAIGGSDSAYQTALLNINTQNLSPSVVASTPQTLDYLGGIPSSLLAIPADQRGMTQQQLNTAIAQGFRVDPVSDPSTGETSFTLRSTVAPNVDAVYDANGVLQGYQGQNAYTSDNSYVHGQWSTTGQANPISTTKSSGGMLGNVGNALLLGSLGAIGANLLGGGGLLGGGLETGLDIPTPTPPPSSTSFFGELGSGTYAPPGELGTEFVTKGGLTPPTVGQITSGGITSGSIPAFASQATGAMGAGLGGAATDIFGNIIPAIGGAATGSALAAIASGAVPAGLVADGVGGLLSTTTPVTTPTTTPITTGAGSLLTPAVTSALTPVAKDVLTSVLNPQTIQGGLATAGGLMQTQASKEAALKAQQDILKATQQATTGAQFRPVGITTRFGTSQFQIDPITGQLVSAGYTTAPEITSAQNQLMKLGAKYLGQSPQEVAQQYMAQQTELLDPLRQRQLAEIRNQAFQTGRGGLSVGSTGLRPSGAQGLMGANPELEAYYNAIAQQNAQLAAQAQQAGQQQVGFGAGLFGQAGQLEQLAQQPFTLGTGLGTAIAGAGGTAGRLGLAGTGMAGEIARSPAATTSPGAYLLSGLGSPTSLLGQGLAKWLTSGAPDTGVGAGGGITNPLMQNPIADIYGSGNVPLGYANF